MSKFEKRSQFMIDVKQAKSVGAQGLEAQTHDVLVTFMRTICKTVLNADDGAYVVQMAIVKLDDEDIANALQEQKAS